MKKSIIIFLTILFSSGKIFSQNVESLSFHDLNHLISSQNGKATLVNFWATWCKPCVDELPFLIHAQQTDAYKNVDFIFVSVDFQSQTQKVKDKVRDLKMTGNIVHLNEKGNDWIDEMDQQWSGAIPYTIMILPDGKRIYHYDAFENYETLKLFLDKNLSN